MNKTTKYALVEKKSSSLFGQSHPSLASPDCSAPQKRDLLGTVLLSVLAGHRRYAHITALRCDPVNPPLLGMRKVMSEDAVRRGVAKIGEAKGLPWLQNHLDYC